MNCDKILFTKSFAVFSRQNVFFLIQNIQVYKTNCEPKNEDGDKIINEVIYFIFFKFSFSNYIFFLHSI